VTDVSDEKQSAVVYITEPRTLDFGPATVFGKVRVMDLPRLTPYVEGLPSNMAFNEGLIHRIEKELADYVPNHDYICPVGAPVIIAAIGKVLGQISPGPHRLLGWDNHTKRYIEYRIFNRER
jgi:hypothetical protein